MIRLRGSTSSLFGGHPVHLHARGVSRVHPYDMTEPIVVTDAAPDELESSRTFEAFYEGEARTLFRRLWLVTGNRGEAEELMQDGVSRRLAAVGPRRRDG